MFWVDLSTAHLIDGSFTTATPTAMQGSANTSLIGQYLPAAKIGNGGFVYVWNGGWVITGSADSGDGNNYFGVSAVTSSGMVDNEIPLMTVAQAYAMDKKMDDGLPQSGNVIAFTAGMYWVAGGPFASNGLGLYETNQGDFSMTYSSSGGFLGHGPVTSTSDIGASMAAGPLSCYDGGSQSSPKIPEQYSIGINNGANVNCALSFRFQ